MRRDAEEVTQIFGQPRVHVPLACDALGPGDRFIVGGARHVGWSWDDGDLVFTGGGRVTHEDVTVAREQHVGH
jgi:hypothetical protein